MVMWRGGGERGKKAVAVAAGRRDGGPPKPRLSRGRKEPKQDLIRYLTVKEGEKGERVDLLRAPLKSGREEGKRRRADLLRRGREKGRIPYYN